MTTNQSEPWMVGGLQITGCTYIHEVTITVPSAGTLVLTSTVHVWIDHTAGIGDFWHFVHSDTMTSCTSAPDTIDYYAYYWPSLATDVFDETGTMVNAISIAGSGTYTYFLNTEMVIGESAGDMISQAETVMVFYPS